MTYWLFQGVALLASIGTVWSMYLVGHKNKLGWMIGIISEVIWLAYVVLTGSWGLAPLSLVLLVVYLHNHWRWAVTKSTIDISDIESSKIEHDDPDVSWTEVRVSTGGKTVIYHECEADRRSRIDERNRRLQEEMKRAKRQFR